MTTPAAPVAPCSERRGDKEKGKKIRIQEVRIQQILPFPFSPDIRPLCISDLWSMHQSFGRSGYHDCILGSGDPEALSLVGSFGGVGRSWWRVSGRSGTWGEGLFRAWRDLTWTSGFSLDGGRLCGRLIW